MPGMDSTILEKYRERSGYTVCLGRGCGKTGGELLSAASVEMSKCALLKLKKATVLESLEIFDNVGLSEVKQEN